MEAECPVGEVIAPRGRCQIEIIAPLPLVGAPVVRSPRGLCGLFWRSVQGVPRGEAGEGFSLKSVRASGLHARTPLFINDGGELWA